MSSIYDERFDGPSLDYLRIFDDVTAEGGSFDVNRQEFLTLDLDTQAKALARYLEDGPASPTTRSGFLPIEIIPVGDEPAEAPAGRRSNLALPPLEFKGPTDDDCEKPGASHG
jgi:hypothetical protein